MLSIEAGTLTESMSGLASFVTALNEGRMHNDTVDLDPESFRRVTDAVQLLRDTATKLDIGSVQSAANTLLAQLPRVPIRQDGKHIFGETEYFMLKEVFNALLSGMNFGLNGLHCLVLNTSDSRLFKSTGAAFGQDVADGFPDSADDIEEACKCLAVGRATATVFHLMRVLEGAMKVVATKIGATVEDLHGRTPPFEVGQKIKMFVRPPLTWWDRVLWRLFRIERRRPDVLRYYGVYYGVTHVHTTKNELRYPPRGFSSNHGTASSTNPLT